jgi:hypothetical protein
MRVIPNKREYRRQACNLGLSHRLLLPESEPATDLSDGTRCASSAAKMIRETWTAYYWNRLYRCDNGDIIPSRNYLMIYNNSLIRTTVSKTWVMILILVFNAVEGV